MCTLMCDTRWTFKQITTQKVFINLNKIVASINMYATLSDHLPYLKLFFVDVWISNFTSTTKDVTEKQQIKKQVIITKPVTTAIFGFLKKKK